MKSLRKLHVASNYSKEFKVANKDRIKKLIKDKSKTDLQVKLELIQWKKAFLNKKEANKEAVKVKKIANKNQAKEAKDDAKKRLELKKNREAATIKLAKQRAAKQGK